jgi:trans-aconitate methyltransferase
MAEWNPHEYNRESSLQQAMAREQLAGLSLRGDERVLDVGCGVGKITADVAARVPKGSVLGVDPSCDMIAFASNVYRPATHANLRFEVGDARCLPYEQEFDLVISFNALHWVAEQAAALRSIHKSLKAGGRASLRFVPAGPRKSIEEVIEDVRKSPHWSARFANFEQPFAHFTKEEYTALAEEAGFPVVRIEVKEKAWDFRSREGIAGFCRATFVEWTRLVLEEQRPAFIAQVLDRYREVAMDRPGEENVFKFYQMEVELAVR